MTEPMDPFFFQNRMSALLDGGLDAGEREKMEAAIAASPELAAKWGHFREVVERVRREGPLRPPESLAGAVVTMPADRPRLLVPALLLVGAFALAGLYSQRGRVMDGSSPEIVVPTVAALPGADTLDPELARPEDALEPEAPVETPATGAAALLAATDAEDRPSRDRPPPEALAEAGGITPEGAAALARRADATGQATPTIMVRGRTVTVERAPYYAEWEEGDEPSPQPSVAPGDYRVRLLANRETALKELAVLAHSVQGQLHTPGGAILAVYLMDPGDARMVHVRLPAASLGAFLQNLPALGVVEPLATPAPQGANAVVRVEVQQPP